jgi:ribosomal protein S18 acetylase RimI-like enzyme
MPVTLRPARPDDEVFLFELYASTRREEVAAWGWNDAQREAFLKMQFNAQAQHYRSQYRGADHRIILVAGQMAGRLYVWRADGQILLVDIALLPAYRGAGVGTEVIGGLLAEAEAADQPVLLHVRKPNPARRLYERLGFVQIGETEMDFEMRWRPGA